jgi:hypothetical protein
VNEAWTEKEPLNREVYFRDIEILALDDPIVRAGLDLYRDNPGLTWSKVLMVIVESLSKKKQRLKLELLQARVGEMIQMKAPNDR